MLATEKKTAKRGEGAGGGPARPVATVRGFFSLLGSAVMAFFSDDCSSMAAALSFYRFFSLPALLTLLITMLGKIAGPERIQHAIVSQVGGQWQQRRRSGDDHQECNECKGSGDSRVQPEVHHEIRLGCDAGLVD